MSDVVKGSLRLEHNPSGVVDLRDAGGSLVASVCEPKQARLLASAPALLSLVERLTRVARGVVGPAPVVLEAEVAVAFLRSEER